MASLSRQHAEAVAGLLKSQNPPSLPLLELSPENNWRVIEARSNLFRELLGPEVNTHVLIGNRVQHPNASADRCGIIGAFEVFLNITKKLTTAATETQPATEQEMDTVREYAEWVQDILWNNRQVNNRSLSTLDVIAMPEWDQISAGFYIVEFQLEYL